MKYKVLIIDDEVKRHSQYEIILGTNFDLDFIKDPSQEFNKCKPSANYILLNLAPRHSFTGKINNDKNRKKCKSSGDVFPDKPMAGKRSKSN